jgi:pimeloyl-ACP methyl ester carboxylesterase
MLDADYEFAAPEHYGSANTGHWPGEHAFALSDEAERTFALIDATELKVHLCGHSYGGGLALHLALNRPQRIASLTLYEPSAFHLLKQIGAAGADAFAEIAAIARQTADFIITGDHRSAAACFVDYWLEEGAFNALLPKQQQALMRWVPKAPLDFRALMEERTPASAYGDLEVPVLILRGQHAPRPTRFVAETLAALTPNCRLEVIGGAGHMGPFTHTAEVNAFFKAHIGGAQSKTIAAGLGKPAQAVLNCNTGHSL